MTKFFFTFWTIWNILKLYNNWFPIIELLQFADFYCIVNIPKKIQLKISTVTYSWPTPWSFRNKTQHSIKKKWKLKNSYYLEHERRSTERGRDWTGDSSHLIGLQEKQKLLVHIVMFAENAASKFLTYNSDCRDENRVK